jgi:hypothetical protein
MKREALGAGGVAAHFSKSARSGAPPGCIIQLSKTNGVIIATPEKVATRRLKEKNSPLPAATETP